MLQLRRMGFEPMRLAPRELESRSLTARTSSLSESINTESEGYCKMWVILLSLQAPSVIQRHLHERLLEGTLEDALSRTRTRVYGVENRNSTPKL